MGSDSLRHELADLKQLKGGLSPQERGRRFEAWLRKLFNAHGLDARPSFRPVGEEIDGSFVLDNRTFLYEAKWPAKSLPASSIYAFKAKVDGKLAGTIGVYISMAGFGSATVDALEKGKDLNVLLVDEADLVVALDIGIDAVLRVKLRVAAEQGTVHFPVRVHEVTASEDRLLALASISVAARKFVVVVEGRLDQAIVARFARRIVRDLRLESAQAQRLVPDFGVDVVASSGFVASSFA